MNLENFKQAYLQTISESTDDSDLKNYIRSIVKKVVSESEDENDDDLEESKSRNHKIEAYGVKGMKSLRWRKTFKNEEELNDWLEKNDAEMLGMRELEESNSRKPGTFVSDNEQSAEDHFKMGVMALMGEMKLSDLSYTEDEMIDDLVASIISDLKDSMSGD